MAVVLPSYPRTPAPGWCSRWIGLPHEMGGRGPDAWDCWGLLMLVLDKQAGLKIPAYEGVDWDRDSRESRRGTAEYIAEQRRLNWTPVEPGQERPFDCIVLLLAGRPLHVGCVASPGWMLHSSDGAGSAVERYDSLLWRHRVDGFWRLRGAG